MTKKKTETQAKYEAASTALAQAKDNKAAIDAAASDPSARGLAPAILALEAEIACLDAQLALYPVEVQYADELIATEAAAGDPDALLANPQNIVDDLSEALADTERARLVWEEKKAAILARRQAAAEATRRVDAKRALAGLPETNWPVNVSDPRVETTAVIEAFKAMAKGGSPISRDTMNGIRQSRMVAREQLVSLGVRHQREQEAARARAEAEANHEARKEAQRRAEEAERLAWRKKCDEEQAKLRGLVDAAKSAE